jgi:hypothetical protein
MALVGEFFLIKPKRHPTDESTQPPERPLGVRTLPVAGDGTEFRYRRVSPVAVRPGEGRFSRPITANQAQRRELVFMSLSSQCRSKI